MSHIRNIAEKLFESEKNSGEKENKEAVGRVLNMIEFDQYFPGSVTDTERLFIKEHAEKHNLVALFEFDGNLKDFAKGVDEFVTANELKDTFCMRCGKSLSNEKSVQKGMGLVCRTKAKENNWVDVRKPRKDLAEGDVGTIPRRKEIAENDKIETTELGRLGLRKLGLKYGVTISTIRHDRDVNAMATVVATKLQEELGVAGDEPMAIIPPEPAKKSKEDKEKEKADKKAEKDKVKQEKADKKAKDKKEKDDKKAEAKQDKLDKKAAAKKEKDDKKAEAKKDKEDLAKKDDDAEAEKKAADDAAFE